MNWAETDNEASISAGCSFTSALQTVTGMFVRLQLLANSFLPAKNCNISNSWLCLPAKSHLKALYPDVPISVFNLLLFINQTCLGDDSYIPYILLHMTYSTQISIAWGMLCQEGYSEHQKLKNSIPGQFWTTFTIKTPFPNYFFIHRVLRKPQKQVSQDSMLIIGCIFVLASHHLFFSSKMLG